MNKTFKTIAILTLLGTIAGTARAEDIKIDFDGTASRIASFSETLKSETAQAYTGKNYIVAEAVEMPGRTAPEFTAAQIKSMDKSITSAIEYVRENNKPTSLSGSLTCLLKTGTPEQKAQFVYPVNEAAYSFPANCTPQRRGICSWITDTVCDWAIDDEGIKTWVCAPVKYLFCGEIEVPAKS